MPDHQVPIQSASAEISRGAVQTLREYTGRGPTKARTSINRDSIAIELADTLTKGERSLVAGGREDQVLEARQIYQSLMKADLIKLVEDHSGRKVSAMLSANHIDPDIGVEFFVLVPLKADPTDFNDAAAAGSEAPSQASTRS